MPDPITGAIVGTSLLGAASSNKAAKQAARGQEKGLAASQAMANQAIGQAKDYFNIGRQSANAGFKSSLDFFKSAQASKYNPMIQGNVAAQRAIGQGAIQANNAILGLPVDMSFANQQTAIRPDYSAIQNATLPALGQQRGGKRGLLGEAERRRQENTQGGGVGEGNGGGGLLGGMAAENSMIRNAANNSIVGKLARVF